MTSAKTVVQAALLATVAINYGIGARLPRLLHGYNDYFWTPEEDRCQAISQPLCMRFGYNHTTMPNFLNHQVQSEAARELTQGYCDLIRTRCSDELPFLLCSFHFPICVRDLRFPIVPCRSLCRRVKRACKPILENASYAWPRSLDCSALPSRSSEDEHGAYVVCVDEPRRASADDFCPPRAPPTAPPPPCPTPPVCKTVKPKKKVFCKNYFGWAARGHIVAETTAAGRHAYTMYVTNLLFSEDKAVLSSSIPARDNQGGFNMTLHTGQPAHCDKCVRLRVGPKDIILAGELSSEAPHVVFKSPLTAMAPYKGALVRKVPRHLKKCNKKHRARLAEA